MKISDETKSLLISKQIEILDDIYDFCDKHNLKVSLSFGTLLGAVRHHGYIPWDHDIDIMMPRNDFNKFCKLYAKETGKFFLQTIYTDRGYRWSFAKVRDSNTTFIEPYFTQSTINQGIWVDIFPYDHSSKNSFLNKVQLILVALKYEVMNPLNTNKMGRRFMASLFGYPWMMTVLVNLIAFLGKGSKTFADFSTNRLTAVCKVDDLFDDFTLLTFEGKQYKCVARYDEYLRINYGDYMEMPSDQSLDKELEELGKCIIDPLTPYTHYLNRDGSETDRKV